MRNNSLLRTKRNLARGDKAHDLSIKGNNVAEVTGFFMELFNGSNKKEHHVCKSEHVIQ